MGIEYPPGTPSWVDLSSPDPKASAAFYGELFGWKAEHASGGYRIFTLDGASVGGLAAAQAGDPPHWTTYIAVTDADDTRAKVEAAGGRTVFGPMDVGEAGRIALFADGADGALFGVWQPGYNRGAQVVNGPGALTMNDLDTRDPDGALRFYAEVFGWTFRPVAEQDGKLVYAGIDLDGRLVGGLMPIGDSFPPEVPANWLAYFGADDLAAARARAQDLGGSVRVEQVDVPAGSFSVLADPHGAVFAILQGTYDPPPAG